LSLGGIGGYLVNKFVKEAAGNDMAGKTAGLKDDQLAPRPECLSDSADPAISFWQSSRFLLSGRAEAAWVLLNVNMGDIWVP
jgi:hypothetical protein